MTRGTTIPSIVCKLRAIEEAIAASVSDAVPDFRLAASVTIFDVTRAAAVCSIIVGFITVELCVTDSIPDEGFVLASA